MAGGWKICEAPSEETLSEMAASDMYKKADSETAYLSIKKMIKMEQQKRFPEKNQ